ncbi:MAG: LDL receptor domain-containing protein [Candidatus Poseidoniaceae archaeon]
MSPRANALLAALLLCLATLPMTVSAQVDPIQNDFAYGVEYDWSNLDEDIDSLTGINLNEILSRTMLAASDAGLNLTVAQLSTGSSNIFVESAEDRTPTTIDLDGDVHDVWMRMTDVTIRHAVLFDSALITEWVDASGADPAGFDGYLSVDSENAVAVDVNMVEYLDDDYNLYGVDMDFSLASEVSVEYMMDVGVEGGGEDFGFAVTFGTAFDFDVPSSSAEWRLGHETPVLSALSTYESVHADCSDNAFITTSGTEADIGIECGMMEGDYTVSTGFSIDLADVPTENFGLDSGLLDLSISDQISSSGSFETDMNDFLGDDDGSDDDDEGPGFGGDADASIIIEEGGSAVDVVSCNCGTANPIMFLMLATMLSEIGEAFAEDAAEELGGTFEDELSEAIEEISEEFNIGDSEDTGDGEMPFSCDNGNVIETYDSWRIGNGEDDCGDWSDEVNGETYFACDAPGEGVRTWEVNDGTEDCSDGSDEGALWMSNVNINLNTYYLCADGNGQVMEWNLENGWDDCADGSDELLDAEGALQQVLMASLSAGGFSERDIDDDGTDDHCYVAEVTVASNDGSSTSYSLKGGYWGGFESMDLGDADNLGFREYTVTGVIHQYGVPSMGCEDATVADIEATGLVASSLQKEDSGALKRLISTGSMWTDDDRMWFSASFEGAYDDDETYTLKFEMVDDLGNIEAAMDMTVGEDDKWWTEAQLPGTVDLEPGEYCGSLELVDSQGVTVDTYEDDRMCMTVEELPEFLQTLETIGEAFGESNFESTLEAFGENLEDRLGSITEDIAYTGANFVMLWSPSHHTVVGVSLAVSDNMDTWYTLVGPEVVEMYNDEINYSPSTPPATIGLTYYIGSAAEEAAEVVEDAQSVDDIADTSAHAEGMGDLAQVLEDAGVDPADLGIDEEDTQTDGSADDGSSDDEPPATAEELIEEGGFGLPSVSGLATVAVLALAGIVAAQRNRDEE